MSELTVSKVLGDDCRAIAADLLQQPELLGAVFLEKQQVLSPSEQERVDAVKRYTGARSTSDDKRVLMVGALRMLGASDREIERSCGVTRRSIPVILAELERSGRVTPLKERLVSLVGDNAERSGLLLRELMERAFDGERDLDMAAMLKAVGQVNVFQLDKLQLLTGQATERIETVVGAGRNEIESWLKSAATPISAQVTAEIGQVDSESTGAVAETGVSDVVLEPVTALERQNGAELDQSAPSGAAGEGGRNAKTEGGGDALPPLAANS